MSEIITKSLFFKDNFAKLPELRMVFPTVENYNKDSYALQILGQLLSGSKKSALYKTIVEESKLAPNVGSYQNSNELAGEFIIRVRANQGVALDDVKQAIDQGLLNFETNHPEIGRPIKELIGMAKRTVPSSASFKSKNVLMVGIREAQVAKLSPDKKK